MPRHLRLLLATVLILVGLPASPKAEEPILALHPGVSYFPLLPAGAPPDARPKLMPVVGNHLLEESHKGITRAVIGIHDASRNAQGVLKLLTTLAGEANATTILLAPQFLMPSDFTLYYQDLPSQLVEQFISWPYEQWPTGGESYAEAPQLPISSFTAVDLLLMYLGDKKYFPDLQQVVIAGHGAGGNFVHLYSAIGIGTNVLEKQGIRVRFVVANATSYLYFTGSRPRQDNLGFTSNKLGCPPYVNYPYGVSNLNRYAQAIGANAIKTQFPERQVTYLTGEGIVAADPFPDTNCMAMVQGANTVARAWNYNRYLVQIFGDDIEKRQKFYSLPNAGYDSVGLYSSNCGMAALFGDAVCTPPGTIQTKTR